MGRARNPSAPGGGEGRSTPAGDTTDPRRNASDSRRGASENASDNSSGATGGESEEISLEIPFEVSAEGGESDINRVALIVWDQLLSTNNMMRIIGENSFTRGLQRLLSVQQQEEIMKLSRTNMIDRREAFIRSNDTNIPSLRLLLQEMFTETIIRHTRGQVGIEKEYVNIRIAELDSLSLQVAEKLAAKDEAANALSGSIRAAHEGIDALHRRVAQLLDDTDLDELQVGTKDHTIALLGDILNNIVKQNTISLPTIIPEVRGENDDQEIYQSDYDQIPEDVKILFSEAAKLVFRAKQAKHEESTVIGDYTLTSTRLDLAAQQGLKLHEAHTKLKELVEFEELVRIIMLEGTFWTHYKVTPPGDNDKLLLDDATQKQSLEDLAKMTKNLSDACYWKNQKVLGKMVKMAKDYVEVYHY